MKISENIGVFRQNPLIISKIVVSNPTTMEKFVVNALWDTGATFSCLSGELVDRMKLKPIGHYTLINPKTTTTVNKYDINFCFGVDRSSYYEVKAGTFESAPDFDFIIGLDLILQGQLKMRVLNGKFEFEFIENIDIKK